MDHDDYIGFRPNTAIEIYVPHEHAARFIAEGGRLLRNADVVPAQRILAPLAFVMQPMPPAEPPREPAAPAEAAKPIKIRGHK